jgi:hypothetical protein
MREPAIWANTNSLGSGSAWAVALPNSAWLEHATLTSLESKGNRATWVVCAGLRITKANNPRKRSWGATSARLYGWLLLVS